VTRHAAKLPVVAREAIQDGTVLQLEKTDD